MSEAEAAPSPVSEAGERLKKAAHRAGVREGDEVGDFVTAAADLYQAEAENVALLMRHLEAAKRTQVDEVRVALTRTAERAMEGAARAVLHGERRRSWAVLGACAAVLVGVAGAAGWAAGYGAASRHAGAISQDLRAAFAGGTEGATWLAQVARLNDTSSLARDCQATSYRPSAGGIACTVRVWAELPRADAK